MTQRFPLFSCKMGYSINDSKTKTDGDKGKFHLTIIYLCSMLYSLKISLKIEQSQLYQDIYVFLNKPLQ